MRTAYAIITTIVTASCYVGSDTDPSLLRVELGASSSGTGAPSCEPDSTGSESSSSSTTSSCESEVGELHECYGWAAGLYQRQGVGKYQFYNLPGGVNEYRCLTDHVCMPAGSTLVDIVDACRSQCDPQIWPLSHGLWTLSAEVCLYEQNGHAGTVPSTMGYGVPGPGKVPNYNQPGGCKGVGNGTGPVGGPVSGGWPLIPMTSYLGECERSCE